LLCHIKNTPPINKKNNGVGKGQARKNKGEDSGTVRQKTRKGEESRGQLSVGAFVKKR
jgi:hypothetical protein